jgi:hypothetical protein
MYLDDTNVEKRARSWTLAQAMGARNETTSYLDASSAQDAERRSGRRDHLCCVVRNQPGAHPAHPPRRLEWDEYRCLAPGEYNDAFAGADVGAFCWHCLPIEMI